MYRKPVLDANPVLNTGFSFNLKTHFDLYPYSPIIHIWCGDDLVLSLYNSDFVHDRFPYESPHELPYRYLRKAHHMQCCKITILVHTPRIFDKYKRAVTAWNCKIGMYDLHRPETITKPEFFFIMVPDMMSLKAFRPYAFRKWSHSSPTVCDEPMLWLLCEGT